MNDELKEFAEELQDFIKRGNKLLNKIGQSMGQRGGQGYGQNYGQGMGQNMGQGGYGDNPGQWSRGGNGYDPRYM